MDGFVYALTLLSTLGCGVVAGVFFAFSAFVMKALGRLPTEQGVAAMQAINVAAVTPVFMTALFGTAAACGGLVMLATLEWGGPSSPYLLAGGASYLLGTVLTTIAYHVPRNEALARIGPREAGVECRWARYLSGWTAWNHARAAASSAATALLAAALHVA